MPQVEQNDYSDSPAAIALQDLILLAESAHAALEVDLQIKAAEIHCLREALGEVTYAERKALEADGEEREAA